MHSGLPPVSLVLGWQGERLWQAELSLSKQDSNGGSKRIVMFAARYVQKIRKREDSNRASGVYIRLLDSTARCGSG